MEKLLTKDQIKSINNTLIDAYGAGTSITNIAQFPKDSLKALGGDNVKPAVSDYINKFNKTGKMLEIARTLVEQARGKNSKYKKFKEAVLAYYGVNTPDELEPVKKKEFYKYIDEQWKRFKASLNPKKETQYEATLTEKKYYVTYNKGRGRGKGLEKEFDKKTFSSTNKPKVFNSFKDAKKYAEDMEKMFRHSIGGGTAYWVSDEKMNQLDHTRTPITYES